jgi:hypothetical protein
VVGLFSRKREREIKGTVCEELEADLRACPRCAARCDSLRASLDLCQQAGAEEVPPAVAASVRIALRRFLAAQR